MIKPIHIAKDHPHFEGHFPLSPVLPGVSQIDLVIHFLRSELAGPVRIARIRHAKFRAVLRPDTHVELHLETLAPWTYRWVLKDERSTYSMGEIELQPLPASHG
jgi:3-hydroxymyristoyl/3-hydroxydecanoyl-(acyl carrier protein) dehydratase